MICSVTGSSAIMVYCSYSAMLAIWIIFFIDGCFLVLVYIECFHFGVVVLKGTTVVTLRSFLTWRCSGWGLLSSSSFSAASLGMYGASRSDLYCGVPSAEPIEGQYWWPYWESVSSAVYLYSYIIILLCSFMIFGDLGIVLIIIISGEIGFFNN